MTAPLLPETPLAPAEAPLPIAATPQTGSQEPAREKRLGRVLHVINGEHYSGAERVQDLLGQRLPEHGFGVGFVALKAGRFGDARRSIDTPLTEASMASKWDLRAAGLVGRVFRKGEYNLLHAHTPRSALIASLAARWTGAPLVYHVHSPTSRDSTRRLANWLNDRVERWSIRHAARLITVSPTLSDHMRGLGFEEDRIRCVLNGVPTVADAAPRGAPVAGWTLGMVALFRPRKGAEVALDALAALRLQGHPVRLQMIGPVESDAYHRQLLERAANLGIAGAVDWIGFTEDITTQLSRIDALVLPSLFGEGLPMVVLEAMAAALPVVATRCEGVAQAVVDRETGRLVEAGDIGGFAAAVEELITGELNYGSLSRAALARHAAEFSDDTMARRVAAVYREVLAGV